MLRFLCYNEQKYSTLVVIYTIVKRLTHQLRIGLYLSMLAMYFISPLAPLVAADNPPSSYPSVLEQDLTDGTVETPVEEEVPEQETPVTEEELPLTYPTSSPLLEVPSKVVEGKKVTYNNITTGTTYIYDFNSAVTINFAALPEGEWHLNIEEVQVTVDGQTTTGYEFTSNLVDGTFEYAMTLPNPYGTSAVVKYSEDGTTYQELTNEEVVSNVLRFTADHFTVFVVVPDDIVPSNIVSYFHQGWRLTRVGNASIGLTDITTAGATNAFGPDIIGMSRPGGAGTNRSFLGYFDYGRRLNEIEQIKWNRFSNIGNDTYLNIFITNSFGGFGVLGTTATVVVKPSITPGVWQEGVFDSSSTVDLRVGGTTYTLTWSELMSTYGNWFIYNDANILANRQVGGIVFVSGSSSPTAQQEHYYDGVTLDFVGEDPIFYDFVQEVPEQPVIEILTPLSGSYVKGTVNVRARITDSGYGLNPDYIWAKFSDGISPAEFGPTLMTLVPGETNIYQANINTVPNNGLYSVGVDVIDNIGMGRSAKNINVTVDNTRPTLVFNNPSVANQLVGSDFTVSVTATDNTVLNYIAVNLYNATNTTLLGTCGVSPTNLGVSTYTFECNIDVDSLSEGIYTLRAGTFDAAGNNQTTTATFKVDKTAPVLTIKGSVYGNSYTPESIGVGPLSNVFQKVSFKLFDNNLIDKVTVNGVVNDMSNNQWSDANNIIPNNYWGAVEGLNTIVLFDAAGNSTSYDFVLDTTAPATPLGLHYWDPSTSSELACGSIVQPKSIWPRWDANTESDFSHYEYTSFDVTTSAPFWRVGLDEQVLTINEFQHSWVPPMDGIYGYAVRSVDEVGNKSDWALGGTETLEDSCQYTVDRVRPVAPVIVYPDENDAFNVMPILNDWEHEEELLGIDFYRVAYLYDDGHVFGGSTCPGLQLEIDGELKTVSGCRDVTASQRFHVPDTIEEGGVNFKVQAFDLAGNEGEWSEWRHYYYDITQPSSSFISPADGAVFGDNVNLEGASVDVITWVDEVYLEYSEANADNWILFATLPNTLVANPYEWSYSWSPLIEDGVYDIRVRAMDAAGNVESTDYIYDIIFDTTSPLNVPVITAPTAEQYFNSIPILNKWTAVVDELSGTNRYQVAYLYDDGHVFGGSTCPGVEIEISGVPTAVSGCRDTSNLERNHTPTLSEQGGITIWVRAIDNAENVGDWSDPIHYYYDATVPAVPTNGLPHNQYKNTNDGWYFTWSDVTDSGSPIHYEFIASQNNSVDEYGVLNSGVWYNTSSSHPEQNPLNLPQILTVGAAEGQWFWQVRAIDEAGNTSNWSEVWNVTIDMTDPGVEITLPTDSSLLSGIQDIRGTVQDSNLAGYLIAILDTSLSLIDGPIIVTDGISFTDALLLNWDTELEADGDYVILLAAADLAWNWSVDFITVTIDNTPPVLVLEPTVVINEGQVLGEGDILEEGGNPEDLQIICNPELDSLPLSVDEDETIPVECTITDAAGNTATQIVMVTILDVPETPEQPQEETPSTNPGTNTGNNPGTQATALGNAEVLGADNEGDVEGNNPASFPVNEDDLTSDDLTTRSSGNVQGLGDSQTTEGEETNTTSPLLVICLVAGALLLILLFLFLFLRRDNEETN